MKKLLFFFSLGALAAQSAFAATCPDGQYLADGACAACPYGHYCNNDTAYACPDVTLTCADTGTLVPDCISIERPKDLGLNQNYVWSSGTKSSISNCKLRAYIIAGRGRTLIEPGWNAKINNYAVVRTNYWHKCNPGYYPSDNWFSSWEDWYRDCKSCTNKPENAVYTGVGAPDSDNCAWQCAADYVHTGRDTCEQLCRAGVTNISINSVRIPLYVDKPTPRALAVRVNNQTCYGALAAGSGSNAINVNIDGSVYHTVN